MCDALFRGIAEARDCIDMRAHRGEHIRIGAADVVPVVALEDGDASDAVAQLGERLATELELPVFLYEQSARRLPFASLPRCRRGGYEALAERFVQEDDGPDLGPSLWTDSVARSGATVLGVRGLLVAMNFTLGSQDVGLARRIARAIRSSGPPHRPHRLDAVRAVGWTMAGYGGRCQVSVNILDPRVTTAHRVLEAVRTLAADVPVLGAELIGLAPARLFRDAAREAAGLPQEEWPAEQVLDGPGVTSEELLREGGKALGLNHLSRAQGMDSVLTRVLERQLVEAGLRTG